MYFDFDDRYRDIEPVGSAINRRDGVALAVVVHAVILALLILAPPYLEQYLPAQAAAIKPPPPAKKGPAPAPGGAMAPAPGGAMAPAKQPGGAMAPAR